MPWCCRLALCLSQCPEAQAEQSQELSTHSAQYAALALMELQTIGNTLQMYLIS